MADAGAGPAEPPQLPPDAPPPPAAAAAAATEPPPQPAGDGDAQPPLPGGEGDAQPPLPGQQEGGDGGAGRSGDDGGTAGPSGGDGGAPPLPEEDEEDPLVVAQREQEAAERAKQEAPEIPPYDEEALKEFYTDLKDAEREGEVQRILSAFKLNPYEQLGLHNDATPEEVRRQYRKVSLMVHPDKCKHARAKDAFEVIGAAQKDLMDEERRNKLAFLLNHAKDEVKKEWKKAAKGDAAVRLAAIMNEEGKQGVEAAFEQTPEFHEAWKLKARDVLARSEWRKRKLTQRITEEEERAKEEFKEEKAVAKHKVKHEKAWEKTRDERVGSWRDFVSKKGGKKQKAAPGGIKPPRMKESDQEKRYIQRPVGEQFRPPPMKHAGPKPKEKWEDE
ncbi:J domain-containing spf31 [Micractinium conductrix]|uniref:J domain-containing spf31 n=1 Tax=Micractinium conductrix TaxID=554055 RepID=A0A2P6VME4_9CHLO|nr:J domain-containing spf31 [Micractinium conductrix]|eukprot:PSC75268.1 J domain-containing spf31 [Micractinium conductrix]